MIDRRKEEDGVSITTGFIINLGIATVAISIFLLLLQGLFTDITESASETQLSVAGERLADELETMDRLAKRQGDADGTTTSVKLPRYESSYTVNVTDQDGGTIILQSGTAGATRVRYDTSTPVSGASDGVNLAGNSEVEIVYESGELVIR